MVTDISDMKVNLIPFELGSRGYISPENKKNLRTLHNFCLPSTHFSTFTITSQPPHTTFLSTERLLTGILTNQPSNHRIEHGLYSSVYNEKNVC